MFFWNSLAFSLIQQMLAIWSLVPLPFLKPAWTSGSSRFNYCWSLAWRILSITLLACAAAAAKLLQSCPTLCDPRDGSPPGSPIPGILQARTLEWVAISFSNAWKWSRSVVSDSSRPHGLQPTRLLGPWDFPGKGTGVGCHCLLHTSMWDECNCVVVCAFFGIAFLWDWNEHWPFPVLWPLLSFPNLLAYWVQHFHSIIFQDLKAQLEFHHLHYLCS